ncbi:hypothetical protein ACJJTC_015086 [Scirpophaga incertulas]
MAPPDAEKRISRDSRITRDSRMQDRSRDRREADQDRMRLAAMGFEGGGESPARLTPVRPTIRIVSDVQLVPPTTGMMETIPRPDEEENLARFGTQSTATLAAPACPAGDAGDAAPRGSGRDRSLPRGSGSAPLGRADADRGSRDRASEILSRDSESAPRGSAAAERGSRDRASETLSCDSESAPRGSAAAERGSRDHAERPPSRGEGGAPPGSAGVEHTPIDIKTVDKNPPTAPSRDTKRETRKAGTTLTKEFMDTHPARGKTSPPSPAKKAQAILATRRPTFRKTNNPNLIKRTPEKETAKPPSPQSSRVPQNSPITPANPPTARSTGDSSYPTPHPLQPKPQRLPRKLEVDKSSSAASRDSSVASIASMTSIDSGPKDVKNRVQKAKSPASHPPAFGTASGLRGKKRAQEDEPEFKQPTAILKYSSLITPPQPSTSAQTTTTYAQAATVGTSQIQPPLGGKRGKRARKPKVLQQQHHSSDTTQPETQQAASGNDKNIQKSTVTGPTQTKQTREQPSTSANTGKQTPLPMSGTTQEATKLPGDSVVAARSGTKAKPVSKESEDAAPKGLKGIIGTIIEGIYKLTDQPVNPPRPISNDRNLG